MTVTAEDGPLITVGKEAARGSVTPSGPTSAPQGYQSGNQNQDAAPNVFYAGFLYKDPLYRYLEGGGSLSSPGGYANQALGFQEMTMDFVPSTISTVNIAAQQDTTEDTPLTLVSVTGAGITVETAAQVVLNSGAEVPAGVLRIDAAPAWTACGDSGAIKAWSSAAAGRMISLTAIAAGNLSDVNFLISGYDIYGRPQSEILVGPNNNTVNSTKAYKWVASITPDATDAAELTIGTADRFEFPLRADRFPQVEIWWNDAQITAVTGFTAADTTSPATTSTDSPRGSYAVQTASDATKRLVVYQRLPIAQLITTPPATGMLGTVPV